MALNYDALTATTRKYFIPSLADQVFNETPLLKYLQARDEPAPGGNKLVQPLLYAENPHGGSFRGYDTLDIGPSDEITAAEYDWKQLYITVTISSFEEAVNRGSLAVLNLLRTKMDIAKMSLKNLMTRQLFGDGTGNNGKDLDGLLNAIDDGTNYPVYGGISRVQYAWWRSRYRDLLGQTITLRDINKMLIACSSSSGQEKPDLVATTADIWEYVGYLMEQATTVNRDAAGPKRIDLGYDALFYRGVPIVYDDACPPGQMFFLNSKYLKLRPHVDYVNFSTTPWMKPTNQSAAIMRIEWMGNLVATNARRLGRIVNIGIG